MEEKEIQLFLCYKSKSRLQQENYVNKNCGGSRLIQVKYIYLTWRLMKLSQQEVHFKHCFYLAFCANYNYDRNRLSLSKNNLIAFFFLSKRLAYDLDKNRKE